MWFDGEHVEGSRRRQTLGTEVELLVMYVGQFLFSIATSIDGSILMEKQVNLLSSEDASKPELAVVSTMQINS